jgi:transposase
MVVVSQECARQTGALFVAAIDALERLLEEWHALGRQEHALMELNDEQRHFG